MKHIITVLFVSAILRSGFSLKRSHGNISGPSAKRLLFFCLGGSHCTPQMDIIQVLLEEGHSVWFVSLEPESSFPLAKKYKETLHVLSDDGLLSLFSDGKLPQNLTEGFFKALGEEPRDISPPGDILWEPGTRKQWPWYENLAKDVKPDTIVFDVVLNGYGNYLAKHIGVPSFGSIPIPVQCDYEGFKTFWNDRAPPGDLRQEAAAHLTQLWREKGWITEKGDAYDLHGANLTFPDYTFSYSSPILEKDTFLCMKKKNEIKGDIVFIGRDYTYDLTQAPLSDDDTAFLDEIDTLRKGANGASKKVAFLSLGTQAQQRAYFNDYVMEALGDKSYVVILQLCSTAGMQSDELDKRLAAFEAKKPKNFIGYCKLKSHPVVMRILNKADVFLSHVGRNTMMEAVSQGVPVITLPVTGDQYENSDVILSEGLGKTVPSMKAGLVDQGVWQENPTPQAKAAFVKELQDTVDEVINDADLARLVTEKKTLATGHGLKVAADIILGRVKAASYVTDPATLESFTIPAAGGYLRALAVATFINFFDFLF